ncbi:MAG: nitrite/sulfite reductase [Gallionellaceae bacterium]|nr:nitrite/sulfite reductase [Gallionellaceae bacterium]
MSVNATNLSDLDELNRFEQSVQAFLDGHLDAERFTAIRLQLGVYGQRQEGVNMLRTKIPGGRLTPDQLDAFADVAETYSQHGIAHITTRQSIQIHFIPLAKTPDAMRRLAQTGMTSREACSNTVRNMSACALSGVCPREHVDVGTHLDGAVKHFLRNPLNQQMPRKFKISFSACEADCAQALLHDAAVVATTRNGQPGFMVKACGGLGHKPREAIVVEEFIAESELLFSLEALVALHNKYSDRTKRAKSRIKFLIDRFGEEGFLEKYREEFGRTKQALAGQPYPQGAWRVPSGKDIPGPGAPRKLFAQHQAGLFVLPVALPVGDITPVQLRGIAQMMRAQGLDEINTTQDQNLAILNVAQEKIAALRAGLAALGLREPVAGDNVVACPGTSTCRLGITSSMVVAPKLSGGARDLRIRVSGCHNGCAQPETGDIGIYGEGKRLHGKLVPHYQMYLGGDGTMGGNGTGHGALALKGPLVPAARMEQAIARVTQAHRDSGEESFFAWVRAQQPDYFKQLLADITEVKAEDIASVMRDHGNTSDFRVINLGGGECAGVSQVMIGANFFEAAHEREYRNALVFQRKYGEAAHCSEAILRLLGDGLVQLMGGTRQDGMAQLAGQLREKVPGELADEFARLVDLLNEAPEMSDAILAPINRAVDAWTLKAAAFCSAQDEQLDLSEALPKHE